MTILAMVNADKEGQIESKMMKARQMEEIREARKAETEKRQEDRKKKLDETKDGMRKKRKSCVGTTTRGSTRLPLYCPHGSGVLCDRLRKTKFIW